MFSVLRKKKTIYLQWGMPPYNYSKILDVTTSDSGLSYVKVDSTTTLLLMDHGKVFDGNSYTFWMPVDGWSINDLLLNEDRELVYSIWLNNLLGKANERKNKTNN